jgi:hypothetical protein
MSANSAVTVLRSTLERVAGIAWCFLGAAGTASIDSLSGEENMLG